MGWVVVYIAPNRAVADMIRELLQREGLMVTIRRLGGSVAGGKPGQCQVMVPSSEAEDASELLIRALKV